MLFESIKDVFFNVQNTLSHVELFAKFSFEDLGSGENSKGRHPQDKIPQVW
jgi:hypothetical protein